MAAPRSLQMDVGINFSLNITKITSSKILLFVLSTVLLCPNSWGQQGVIGTGRSRVVLSLSSPCRYPMDSILGLWVCFWTIMNAEHMWSQHSVLTGLSHHFEVVRRPFGLFFQRSVQMSMRGANFAWMWSSKRGLIINGTVWIDFILLRIKLCVQSCALLHRGCLTLTLEQVRWSHTFSICRGSKNRFNQEVANSDKKKNSLYCFWLTKRY